MTEPKRETISESTSEHENAASADGSDTIVARLTRRIALLQERGQGETVDAVLHVDSLTEITRLGIAATTLGERWRSAVRNREGDQP